MITPEKVIIVLGAFFVGRMNESYNLILISTNKENDCTRRQTLGNQGSDSRFSSIYVFLGLDP